MYRHVDEPLDPVSISGGYNIVVEGCVPHSSAMREDMLLYGIHVYIGTDVFRKDMHPRCFMHRGCFCFVVSGLSLKLVL